MQAVWHVTVADTGSIKIATMRGTGGDNIDHSGSSHSLALCASTSTDWHTAGYRNCVAHRTLLITCHSEPIVPQALDEDPTLLILTCRVLTAHSQLSQHLTPSRWMTQADQGNLALAPLMSL